MRKYLFIYIPILLISATMFSCKTSSTENNKKKADNGKKETGNDISAGPPVIIYKTKGNYYDKVPVTLSEDKSKIISYPGSRDLYYQGKLAYPAKLHNGFLLDNRGIDENVAFLDITYETFTKSAKVFTTDELYEMLLDKDPVSEMYYCGSKFDYDEIEVELNEIIDNELLESLKKLK